MENLLKHVNKLFGRNFTAIKQLGGEADLNYWLKEGASSFLLKISELGDEGTTTLDDFQLFFHLAEQNLPFQTPEFIGIVTTDDRTYRFFTFLPGRQLADLNPITSKTREAWGAMAAQINLALGEYPFPIKEVRYKWDPANATDSRPLTADFPSEADRELALRFFDRFEAETLPRLGKLRRGLNHNDVHQHNVLVDESGKLTGLIDFGDAIVTHTVSELAIACAYAGMGAPDPLTAICELVSGFHAHLPLEPEELEVLFDLIRARLFISVCQSARNKKLEPDNAYLTISEGPAWSLIYRLEATHPTLALIRFRDACGMEPHPGRAAFDRWVANHKSVFHPVIDLSGTVGPLDLSVGSHTLGNTSNFATDAPFEKLIRRYLEDENLDVAVGGYNEVRPIYTTTAYQTEGNNGPRWRTTHLGLDFWTEAGTPVYAPIAGQVHSFHYDPAPRSYGATLILQHEAGFFTLYGHIDRASIEGIKVGQPFAAGEQIALIGPREENGGWPPHLHFQVTLDMLGLEGNFPGVAYPQEAETWLSLCPNPISLLPTPVLQRLRWKTNQRKLASEPPAPAEPKEARFRTNLGPNLSLSYTHPLHIQRGYLQHLYAHDGRRYLDTVNNVAHVGHEHPYVVEQIARQAAVLNTNTRYLHDNITQLAEALTATLPDPLEVVYFVNSGSEANELALRMSEAWTGHRDMTAIGVGYHGNTGRTIDVSSYKFDGKGGSGAPKTTTLLDMPDVFRGKYQGADAGAKYVKSASETIRSAGQPGSLIAESILSCGGQIVPPGGYLKSIYSEIRERGGLCIADEVQTGFGRVGSHYWAFELHGVVPDIVTLGKPFGNGHPLGAVVCTRAVADRFANGMEYFNTFGGNPVSCAAGLAVMKVVEEEGLQENALAIGNYLKAGLRDLQKKFPIIGDVRGEGLFLGFELVSIDSPPGGRGPAPASAPAYYLKERMRELGFLMSTDGPAENVLKIKPPICFSGEDCDQLLKYLSLALGEDGSKTSFRWFA